MSTPDEEETRQEGSRRASTPLTALEPGSKLGRFVIEGVLGQGGMGVVYAATDPELARKVAVKLVRTKNSRDAQERLLREAQAMARLQHPNVVAIYDVGTFQRRVFLAMELVEGENLRLWLKKERSWRDIVRVFSAAGAGLAAAHAAGVVHRDFKPDNVLVDRAGRARVTDFGLARNADDHEPTGEPTSSSPDRLGSELTQAGTVVGTPGYMAPEQRGEGRNDARTDQFAFCVSLYEALYGQRPFPADSWDMRPPPAVSRVPARIRRIVLRGLARDPDARWPSMAALLAALDRDPAARARWIAAAAVVLGGAAFALWLGVVREPTRPSCDDPQVAFGSTWSNDKRAAVRAAFAQTKKPYAEQVFTTVAGGLDKAAASWKTAHLEACRATRVRHDQPAEVMLLRHACLERQRVQLASIVDLFSVSDAKTLDKAVQGVAALPSTSECDDVRTLTKSAPPPADPSVRAEIETLRLQLASASGLGVAKPAEALARYQPIVARAKQIGYRALEAEALFAVGVAQLSSGDNAGAKDSLDAAVLAAEASGLDRIAALGCGRLVAITANRGRLEESRAWAARGRAILERIGGDPAIEALIDFGVALTERNSAELVKSVELLERVVAARMKLYGPDHPDTLIARVNLASTLEELARADKAIAENEAVIATLERTLGPQTPRLILPLLNLALVRARNGDLDVDPLLQRATVIASTLPGKNHYRAGASLVTADVYLLGGRVPESVEHGKAAIELTREATGDKSDMYGWALTTYGAALAAQGKHQEAITSLRAGLAVREALDPRLVALARDYTYLGEAELAAGDQAAALRSLERALALSEGRPRFPGEQARTQFALARAVIANHGDRDRARELAKQARSSVGADKARGDAIDAFLAKLGE